MQIQIQDILPLLRDGFVAMNLNGDWCYHQSKPELGAYGYCWVNFGESLPRNLSTLFDIDKFDGDWKDSCMICGEIKALKESK